jgi:hypothetical protein
MSKKGRSKVMSDFLGKIMMLLRVVTQSNLGDHGLNDKGLRF